MSYSTEIFLSKKAIETNIRFLQKTFGERVRISSVVKANAYGHGIEHFVPVVEECGIDHFSTFSFHEAVRVRRVVSNTTDIMIMGWIDVEDIESAISKGFEFFVFEYKVFKHSLEAAKKLKTKAKIHIEIETGLNRTGLSNKDFIKVIDLIKDNSEHLEIKGICSHLAGAESIANHVRVESQINKFKLYREILHSNGIKPEYSHIACSAGAMSYPHSRFNMVRIGIMQYGFWSSMETFIRYKADNGDMNDPLERVICWKSKVMSIKKVRTGEFISYGTTYLASEDKTLAIVPVGYSNGYSRSLSNNGRVLINGIRCGVIGLVNMNMIIADITTLPEDSVQIGDEVVIVGVQDNLEISVDSFSEISQQVNYEILSRIPKEIPRYIID